MILCLVCLVLLLQELDNTIVAIAIRLIIFENVLVLFMIEVYILFVYLICNV